MYSKCVFVLLALTICAITAAEQLHPLSDEFIDLINKKAKWKAGRNFHPDTPISHIKGLLGAKLDYSNYNNLPTVNHSQDLIDSLPKSFDPREKWPNCSSLSEIRDQGSCGSCWVMGAVSAMTDRVCIHSNGAKYFHFSAEDVLDCSDSGGCDGGFADQVWKFWVQIGIVSGGNYNSHEGCRPYSIPPCEHNVEGNRPKCTEPKGTPPCVRQCDDGYGVSYENDKRRGKTVYMVEGEANMMAELFQKGPIEAVFEVYYDFLHYKKGVYKHDTGKFVGGHAVKLMGWGVEDGQKYWLVANSWNTDWGDNGYFKILRGDNECKIERNAVAGDLFSGDY